MAINKVAVVDIETTGPHYEEGDRIIQIGAIIIENGQITARHSMLLNPEIQIPDQIIQLTGITQSQVDKAPIFKNVVDLWYHRLKDCFFVAHNLDFDLSFLTYYFKEYGGYDFYPEGFDTVKLARIFLPEATGFNLTDLSQYLSLTFDNAHDALVDAELTAHVLNEIAHRVIKLPIVTRIELLPYLDVLPAQEKYILKYTNAFAFKNAIATKENSVGSTIQTTRTEDKHAEYLRELWDQHNYLVIEQERPFTLAQFISLVKASLDKQLLIVCSSTSQAQTIIEQLPCDNTMLLQSARNYLHVEAFRKMCEKVTPEQMNQQEIIIVSAIIQWLSYAKECDLSELNAEMDIIAILKKYVADSISIYTHSTYKRIWKKAQTFQYLLTVDDAIDDIIASLPLKNRSIIVLDVMHLFDRIQSFENIYFPISEWFTKFRLMVDRVRFSSEQKSFDNIFIGGSEIIDTLHDLLEYLRTLLKEQASTQEGEFIEYYISKNSLFYQEIQQSIYIIRQQFQTLMTLIQKHHHILSKQDEQHMKQFEICIQQMTQPTSASSYWTIRAQRIQGEFYGIYLVKAFYTVSNYYVDWLSIANQSLILSNGGYLHRQRHGIDARMNLRRHQYLAINAPSNSLQHTIKIPISYIEPVRDSNAYFASIGDFIQDFSTELDSHIVIFATNRQSVVQLYEHLTKLEEFTVFAQGISGSLRKIRRRAQETKRSIIIVPRHQAQSEGWGFTRNCSIILQHLPFASLTDYRVLAAADFADYTTEQIFPHFLLPQMCLELKQFMQYSEDCLQHDAVYLFDERVFTKYYSAALRENVENMINFEIIE